MYPVHLLPLASSVDSPRICIAKLASSPIVVALNKIERQSNPRSISIIYKREASQRESVGKRVKTMKG